MKHTSLRQDSGGGGGGGWESVWVSKSKMDGKAWKVDRKGFKVGGEGRGVSHVTQGNQTGREEMDKTLVETGTVSLRYVQIRWDYSNLMCKNARKSL